jgi:hypothetical protein
MKTTLDLPDELLIQAKKTAAEQRRPLRELVEEGLRMVLREPQSRGSRTKKVRLITVKGGLPPDLELTSREKMYEWIEKK